MVELITASSRLAAVVEALLREPRVAVDTESDSFHHYPERVCLVQLASSSRAYLVDTLAIEDVSPLGDLLAHPDVEKVLHSADYDLRSLDRQWGFAIRNLYDTSVAAHFLGMERLGLGTVVGAVLGLSIEKSKRLQRANWGERPLPQEALDYAATDVAHLLPLRDALHQRLDPLGRTAWVAEECVRLERVRHNGSEPPERTFFALDGRRKLDGRGLAVLRELVVFREAEARRWGRPPFHVLSNDALVFLAEHPEADLAAVPGLSDGVLRRLGRGIREAMRAGLASPPVRRPVPPHGEPPLSEVQAQRLRRLKAWRTQEGARLGLDPARIWPMASLTRLARDPRAFDAELASPEVRQWQRRHFEASLQACLGAADRPSL